MKTITIFIICLLFCGFSFAQKLRHPEEIREGKLKNGLTYYIYPNDYPKGEAIYRLFIKSGSIYEEDDQQGLAHFIEHMAFNGTKHFPGDGIVRFLESKGAKFGKDLNAHTAMNETVYKLQLPSEDPQLVDSTLMILADWADGLRLDSIDIEEERGVILSEWLSKTGPAREVQNAFLMELLNGSRYADRLTIGDTAVIRHFAHERLKAYYENWYHPSRMAVAVTGDINPDQVEKMIVDRFGSIKGNLKQKAKDYSIDSYSDRRLKTAVHPSLDKIELCMMQLIPRSPAVTKEQDYQGYLQRVLVNKLFKERFNTHSFEAPTYMSCEASVSDFMNVKGILYSAVTLNQAQIKSGICDFATTLENVYKFGFTNAEITKIKNRYMGELRRSAEPGKQRRSSSLMDELYTLFYKGNQVVSPAEEYRLAEKYISQIDSVSFVKYLQSIRNTNETHYLITSFTTNNIPSEKELFHTLDSISSSVSIRYAKNIHLPEVLLNKMPTKGSITNRSHIEAVNADVIDLSNGTRVIYRPSRTPNSKIQISGFRRGGFYALDTADYVSGLYASSVIPLCGAGDFSREALSLYLAGNSTSARFLIDKTRSGVACAANPADSVTLFQLLYLKWTQPRIDTTTFNLTLEKSVDEYRAANRTAVDTFYREVNKIMEGESYVRRSLTDSLMLQETHIDRLLPIFNKCYGNANGYTFIIISPIPLEDILPLIVQYIGGLPSGDIDTEYRYKGNKLSDKSKELHRCASDSPKATVTLTFQQSEYEKGLRIQNLECDILKAVIRTKLLKELREKMGMIYSVSVSSGATLNPRPLCRQTITFNCEPANASLLIEHTYAQLKNMVDDPECFEAELADVKKNLVKEMMLNKQKDSFWISFIRNSIYNNENDWNFVDNYESIVNNISSQDIANIIKDKMLTSPKIEAVLYPKNYNCDK